MMMTKSAAVTNFTAMVDVWITASAVMVELIVRTQKTRRTATLRVNFEYALYVMTNESNLH